MKKWVRNLLKGTSLSTALFIFQACYGMPIGYDDVCFSLEVIDGDTDKPIPDANVMFKESGSEKWTEAGRTDQSGQTYVSFYDIPSLDLKFEAEAYKSKDTTITELYSRGITIKLYKEK